MISSYTGIKGASAPAQTNASHTTAIGLAKQLGATHYRYAFEIGWGLEALDHIVTQCKAQGMKLILCVFRNDRVMPTTLTDAQAHAATVVSLLGRTQGICTHVENWNEPNHLPFVTVQNAAAFAQLQIEFHKAVKLSYPTIKTITGGLSPETSPNAPDQFFLNACAADARFASSFDLVGFHPYCFPFSPLGTESWNNMKQAVNLWSNVKSTYGRTVTFAATEFGAPSSWTTTYLGNSVTFDEAKQAQWMSDYFKAFAARGPSWAVASVFMPKDGSIGGTWEPSTGMYRSTGVAKPAATAFKNA